MLNGYRVIDADAHVHEPPSLWADYLEPAFRHFAPSPDLKIQGESVFNKLSEAYLRQWSQPVLQVDPLAGTEPHRQLQAMLSLGADLCFLYPTSTLFILAVDTMAPALVGAFVRAYNNWLYDFCQFNPSKLKGVGAINRHAPAEMVPELLRIAEFGWRAVFLRPNPVQGRLLSDPAYAPFWQHCEDLNIAVCLHEGTPSRLPTAGADRFATRFAMRACAHPMEQMMAFLTLLEGGVLEQHPQLRIGFLESGSGWLPYWLWRLDQEYESSSWEVAQTVQMKPSDYFRRQCFIGLEPGEPYLPWIVDYIGADSLIFGSDYPHGEFQPDVVEQLIACQAQLPAGTIQKILWDNPARLYGLDEEI
ncbi:MAG: amidohydrolase family protein [Cyanobacteria bacterium P01_G01_bin.54]